MAEAGDDAPVEWLAREERYNEKLATPDVSIADLLGDIDPIKAATRKLTYADPEVIHFGIVPRTNRGIFAINELPDLAPRIQVGLLNILEERDLQIRGFPVRIPLDVLMVFSANPEDYTNPRHHHHAAQGPDRRRSSPTTRTRRAIAAEITARRPGSTWRPAGRASARLPPPRRGDHLRRARQRARGPDLGRQRPIVDLGSSSCWHSNLERRALATGDDGGVDHASAICHAAAGAHRQARDGLRGRAEGVEVVARQIIGGAVKQALRRALPGGRPGAGQRR